GRTGGSKRVRQEHSLETHCGRHRGRKRRPRGLRQGAVTTLPRHEGASAEISARASGSPRGEASHVRQPAAAHAEDLRRRGEHQRGRIASSAW
ncbi:unnamed protein product, partial [Ectocarpus sp. 4 AP-2014]